MERCEWNPVLKQAAFDPPLPTDCPNEATVSVGERKNWHLCESCAALPEFRRFRRRRNLRKDAEPRPR